MMTNKPNDLLSYYESVAGKKITNTRDLIIVMLKCKREKSKIDMRKVS